MNRGIVIFVSLAILVAHSLAIRTDTAGALAPPYDQAFVAFRVARSLVFEGDWSWSPGQSGFDSYPSILWVFVCAVIERLSLSINGVVRLIGLTATAGSFIMATRFHPDRVASLITPMLLAISGAMAAAAVSGTETAVFTVLVTASFLAYERRSSKVFAFTLLLCGLTRGEGWVLALVFLAMRISERLRAKEGSEPHASLLPFLLPLAGFAGLTALRFQLTGSYASPWALDLIDLRPGELENGLHYVRDFFIAGASPALILYAFWYLLRRNLSLTGKRALFIFVSWTAVVIAQGGGTTPLSESMVPILPLILIAGQEGLINALESQKAMVRRLAWSSFLVAVLASTLASFRPTNKGPLELGALQREWMRAKSQPRFSFDGALGRGGLDEEARSTRLLRDLAIYMRDQIDPRRTVLTPWPGSLAYLSSLPVTDLLGRATPAMPMGRKTFSPLQIRVDVIAALESQPDYIAAFWRKRSLCPTTTELAQLWFEELDSKQEEDGRLEQLIEALGAYELITVPLSHEPNASLNYFQDRAYLLRRRALQESPKLHAELDGDSLVIHLEHTSHPQLGNLLVRAVDSSGDSHFLAPPGNFVRGKKVLTRSNLLLTETGERQIQLLRADHIVGLAEMVEVHITLVNPRSNSDSPEMRIAEELVLEQ
ncbi:MAG: hypothetical protein ACI8X5_000954 [Planctomycetota bacterium]|jgi:hypothetical protein